MTEKYLDIWIAEKIGVGELTRKAIESYQLEKLKETFQRVVSCSPFYADLYKNRKLESMEDLKNLPFITSQDLCDHGLEMLCVSPGQISRIVSMETSGTAGKPKRIYFTEEDQQLTVHFFHHGMKLIVNASDVFMILMPCQTVGSIGVLLQEALERSGLKVIPYGIPRGDDIEQILHIMEREQVTGVVALPSHLKAIAKESGKYTIPIRSVLLSAEYVSEEARNVIKEAWNCKVFEHYGMTEMGLGCAVHCPQLDGFHIRECDLYIEIIDPVTGRVLPDGEEGEIVFTTLTRKGMPLIRYRTGDWSSFKKEPCACGSVLKSLTRVGDRHLKKGGYYGR